MADLGLCPDCQKDLSDYDLIDLPDGYHGVACPRCDAEVYCGICGDLTIPE